MRCSTICQVQPGRCGDGAHIGHRERGHGDAFALEFGGELAGALEQMFRAYHPDTVEPSADDLAFANPGTGDPLGHRLMYERLRLALRGAHLD